MENIEETFIGSVVGSDTSPFAALRRDQMVLRAQNYAHASLETGYKSLASDPDQHLVTKCMMPFTKHVFEQFQTDDRLWPYSPLGYFAREEDHPLVRFRKDQEKKLEKRKEEGILVPAVSEIIPKRVEAVKELRSPGFVEKVILGFCFAHYFCTNSKAVEAVGRVLPEAFMIQYERDRAKNVDAPGVLSSANATLHCGTKQVIDDAVAVMYDTAEQEGRIAFTGFALSVVFGQGLKYASRSASSMVGKVLLTGARGSMMATGGIAVLATGAKIYDGFEKAGLREPLEPHVMKHMDEVGERIKPVCEEILEDSGGDLGTIETSDL